MISPVFLINELFDYCDLLGNKYLQYMSDLKRIDVITPYYYKIDGEFVAKDDSDYHNFVNYYYSKNFRRNVND